MTTATPPTSDVLIHEPADVYHANAGEYLSSHLLADFRKCPLLYHRKRSGLIPDEDRPAYLVGRVRRGDQGALETLVVRHYDGVYAEAFCLLREPEAAEDAAQESLVRMLRSLHRWDTTRDFVPWLLAIAGNRCRTAMTNRQRRMSTEELPEHVPDRPGNDGTADHLVGTGKADASSMGAAIDLAVRLRTTRPT